MDFRLSDEQRAIADLAGELFAGDGANPPTWETLFDAGLPSLLVAEAQGGVGLGQVELAQVLIAQGRGLVSMPLWRHALAAQALSLSGKAPRDGDRLSLALDSVVTVRDAPEGLVLDGEIRAVVGAGEASCLVLPAGAGEAARLYVIALDHAGVTAAEGVLTDGERASDLKLRGVPAVALDVDMEWLGVRAAACLAALAVGVARGAIERTADYVGTRYQFGRAIGSFQAVGQRMADAFSDVEVAHTLLFELAWRIDADAEIGSTAEIATYWANQCSHRVSHAAMHLHGGIGADTSYPIHRVLLMSRALEMMLGGPHRQLARIGERLAA
ncbi:acyl-CoA dehydrogenase family protein [soil metagenome]